MFWDFGSMFNQHGVQNFVMFLDGVRVGQGANPRIGGRPTQEQVKTKVLSGFLSRRGHHILGGMSSALQNLLLLACGCCSSGWALVLLAAVFLELVGWACSCFLSCLRGRISAGIQVVVLGLRFLSSEATSRRDTWVPDWSDGWRSSVPKGTKLES